MEVRQIKPGSFAELRVIARIAKALSLLSRATLLAGAVCGSESPRLAPADFSALHFEICYHLPVADSAFPRPTST